MAPDKPNASNMSNADGNVPEALTIEEIKMERVWITNEDTASFETNCEEEVTSAEGSLGKHLHADDDLTSLSWLHQQNILKTLEIPADMKKQNILNNNECCEESADCSDTTNSVSSFDDGDYSSEYTDLEDKESKSPSPTRQASVRKNRGLNQSLKEDRKSRNRNTSPISHSKMSGNNSAQSRNKHPSNVPYDPILNKDTKPPYSFSSLIFMAIDNSVDKALLVKEVYAWIVENFPYYQNAPAGWKNSVRHNLSLNKCFHKLEKCQTLGKGCLWTVDAKYRPNLLQAVARVPCLSAATRKTAFPEKVKIMKRNHRAAMNHIPDPTLFPYLSKRLALRFSEEYENGVDSEVGAAATAMMSFKHGFFAARMANDYEAVATTTAPKRAAAAPSGHKPEPIILKHHRANRKRKMLEAEKLIPVITRNANEDHTYSRLMPETSPEKKRKTLISCQDDLEKFEGADALLDLAAGGIPWPETFVNLAIVNISSPNEPDLRPGNVQNGGKRPNGDAEHLHSNGDGTSFVKKYRG